ncbi:hypothetical protein like AT4G31115 [Hibiscus trionum]|uniref:DUF1997 family protein n=1 Tax=Hibiscus trionum TaxID=183268 RepID=A0A9W7IBV1_HIBTR|nr:hypothetical protein like AT4G31115 [Hibiscus trionum]
MKTAATASSNGWRWSFLSPQLSSSISPGKATLPLPIKLRLHPYRVKNGVVASGDAKRANLSASRTQRVKLQVYDATSDGNGGQPYHISQFLSHPSGIKAILNTRALEKIEFLDTSAYRCTLPKLALFNFEATPVLDLRVIPTEEDCTVELFSCKFKGSEVLERQNEHFSATMINHITWDTNISEPFLEVDVKLNLSLEVYTRPFILLPISAVERPGNVVMQALVDRLVPLLLQQLVEDYDKWVQLQKQLIN